VTGDERRPGRNGRWVVLAAVMLGLFTYGTITTVLTASLAKVAEGLDSDTSVMAWTITGPFLALGVGNPVFGKVGDVYGRKRLYLLGMAVFALATIGCAVAPNAAVLIALRAVAGLGASASIPNGTALVLDNFSLAERARALGWFNLVGTGAPAIGLVLGGPLVDAFGWRAVFAVYGGIAVAGFFAAVVLVDPSPAGPRVPIDIAGSVALGTAALGLMLGMTVGARSGFGEPATLALLLLAPAGVAWFVTVERRAAHPLVPLAYFRRRNFTAPLTGYFLAHVAYMGAFVITPILLDQVFGYALSIATAILLLRPLSFSVASPLGGVLTTRIGVRPTSVAGSAALVGSMIVFTVGASVESVPLVVVALCASGVCLGVCSPPYATALTTAADPRDLGLATGMLQTAASLGTVVGIQTAVLALGAAEPHTASDFTLPYLLGVVAATLMVGVSAVLRPAPAS
jgi:MFS family permease